MCMRILPETAVRAEGRGARTQSSVELLIMLSFGLVILLPLVTLAFLQISSSSSSIYATEAQGAAEKLAAAAAQVASEGYPAQQAVSVQIPQNVQAIYVGTTSNSLGNQITFVVNTNGGLDYVTAYTPVNVSGDLSAVQGSSTYIINVSAQTSCPARPGYYCVYMKPVPSGG